MARRVFENAKPVSNPKARKAWAEDQDPDCQVCGRYEDAWDDDILPGLCPHHIIGAAGRSDESCNLLLVCRRCHDLIHDGTYRDKKGQVIPKIRLGIVLTCKMKSDPRNWNPKRLEALAHKILPPMEDLPEWLINERARWHRVI